MVFSLCFLQVIPPSADWILYEGKIGTIDVRTTLKTDDGQFIYLMCNGKLEANDKVTNTLTNGVEGQFGDSYLFVTPYFEVASNSKWAWLVCEMLDGDGEVMMAIVMVW